MISFKKLASVVFAFLTSVNLYCVNFPKLNYIGGVFKDNDKMKSVVDTANTGFIFAGTGLFLLCLFSGVWAFKKKDKESGGMALFAMVVLLLGGAIYAAFS